MNDKKEKEVIVRNSLCKTNTFSNSGSKFENVYEYSYDEDTGQKDLVYKEKHNVYEIIQSHKDDTNIYKILNRVMQGDYSVLDTNKGCSLDTSKLPTSINEYHMFIEQCKNQFNSLDPKLKSYFNNSYDNFAHILQKGDLDIILKKYNEEVKGIKTDTINTSTTINQADIKKEVVNE